MTGFIGNERAVAAVQRALAGGSPPHAWLFVGPERVGKATLARMVTQTLNCETSNQQSVISNRASPTSPERIEPCGECRQCRRIAAGIHSDVQTVTIELDDDGRQRKGIGVDQLREVERSVALKPFEGRTRVVIIDPADDMTTEAQNAFLKTLEEPPPDVVFVLIATREDRLLPTVRSRCRRIEFRLVPAAIIERALVSGSEDPDLRDPDLRDPDLRDRDLRDPDLRDPDLRSGVGDAERAALLARLAGGRIGWALAMAGPDGSGLLARRREVLEQARALATMPLADRFDLAERLQRQFREDREVVLERVKAWQGWWRDVLLVSASGGSAEGVSSIDMLSELREDAGRCDARAVFGFVQALIACREHLQANVQSRIALDALMVEAPPILPPAGG